MQPSLSVASAAGCGFLLSLPLALTSSLSLIAMAAEYSQARENSYTLHLPPGEPWISLCLVLFSAFAVAVAIGLWFCKEQARRAAVHVFGPLLLFLLVATCLASVGTAIEGIYLVISLYAMLLLIPIALWWAILFSLKTIRAQFGAS
jgi:hypothetical protein